MSFFKKDKNHFSIYRSYDRSSRSLDQDSPSKKKKFQTNYASTTHLMTGKKVPSSLQTKPSDLETTVFYIPGVDVKVKEPKSLGLNYSKHCLFSIVQVLPLLIILKWDFPTFFCDVAIF